MGETDPATGNVFQVARIRELVELMKEFDLRELDLRQEEQRIQLKRGAEPAPQMLMAPAAQPAAAPPPAAAPAATPAAAPAAEGDHIKYIKSPMVGTFYAKPNPEAESFVKIGDHVSAETTVCVIEAMKVFNEIPAECSGRIVAVLAQSGDPVEFNQPLFRVEPN